MTTTADTTTTVAPDTVDSLRAKLARVERRLKERTKLLVAVMDALDEAPKMETGDITDLLVLVSRIPDLERWWKEHRENDEDRKRDEAVKSREIELGRLSDKIRKIKALDGLVSKAMLARRDELVEELRKLRPVTTYNSNYGSFGI